MEAYDKTNTVNEQTVTWVKIPTGRKEPVGYLQAWPIELEPTMKNTSWWSELDLLELLPPQGFGPEAKT